MDIGAPFKQEVFKPLATLVIPGTVALGPYVVHLMTVYKELPRFFEKHEITYLTVVVLAVIAVGFILEDLGSIVEADLWDRLRKESEKHNTIWYEYLRTSFKEEPIGQGYLRTIVLRMKFELSFGLSLIPMWVGVLALSTVDPFFSGYWRVYLTILIVVLFTYLLWESYRSSHLLGRIREELAKGIIVKPSRSVSL